MGFTQGFVIGCLFMLVLSGIGTFFMCRMLAVCDRAEE
jgi:hypothetical protein